MKILKYLSLVLAVALIVSCEKNEITYNATPTSGMAEFQLHYYVPVNAVSANNINRVEVNGKLYSNSKSPLSTYNVIPSGTTGRFYAVTPGTVNMKLYMNTKITPVTDSLVYDQNLTLAAGKQNIFLHNFTQTPVIFENGYPYEANVTEITDSTAWVKFYNFLYEANSTTPTTLKLQYQYIDYRTNQPVNLGSPVSFGETTGWQPVTVVKDNNVSAGSRLMTFKIKVVDASGAIIGDLQTMNTAGTYVNYNGTSTLFLGRRYHHTIAGLRAAKTPGASVRIFTAL